ncbi:TlyA family RNA methyltransferase [Ardenticatena maritima]|nr:TlyA family RNA methyltransferase [Ardenticatena maritima]KPL90056.1 hypothetical protein SE16_00275 [Ardenticatena maritima]
MGKKERLDVLLVHKGLVESRTQAQRLIMAGAVRVDGQVVTKAGTRIPQDAVLEVEAAQPYVSRGGYKLAAALDTFGLDVRGMVAADVGASTGGFTDVLLQRGAKRVYAIDVGYGQLAWKLREDERVVVMERTNARYVEKLPETVHLVTIDASFISQRLLLPAVRKWLDEQGHVVALIKPQFEAGRDQVGRGGVVRHPAVHKQVLQALVRWAYEEGWCVNGLTYSPIRGPSGNIEFLWWLRLSDGLPIERVHQQIDEVVEKAHKALPNKAKHIH